MPNYRTLDNLEEDYCRNHPDEIGPYLDELFEAFAQDSDVGALLASLRTLARAKGMSTIAEEIGMSRQGLQKVLSTNGSPCLERVNAILGTLGYRLAP